MVLRLWLKRLHEVLSNGAVVGFCVPDKTDFGWIALDTEGVAYQYFYGPVRGGELDIGRFIRANCYGPAR